MADSEECAIPLQRQGPLEAKASDRRRHETFETSLTDLPPTAEEEGKPRTGNRHLGGCKEFDTETHLDNGTHLRTPTEDVRTENCMEDGGKGKMYRDLGM